MLSQRGIRGGPHLGDQRRLGLRPHPARATGSGRGGDGAGLVPPSSPSLDRAHANAKESGRLGLGQAGVDRPQQPLAEVGRVLLHPDTISKIQLFRNLL